MITDVVAEGLWVQVAKFHIISVSHDWQVSRSGCGVRGGELQLGVFHLPSLILTAHNFPLAPAGRNDTQLKNKAQGKFKQNQNSAISKQPLGLPRSIWLREIQSPGAHALRLLPPCRYIKSF